MTPEQGIKQAEVMRRWYEQKKLPESERDILEFRHSEDELWTICDGPSWSFSFGTYRLRKRPRQKTVTVYLYRNNYHLMASLLPSLQFESLGQADITYEETNDDTR